MLKCSVMSQTQGSPITKLIRDTGPEQRTSTAPGASSPAAVLGIFQDWLHYIGTPPSLVLLYGNNIFHFHLVTSVGLTTC